MPSHSYQREYGIEELLIRKSKIKFRIDNGSIWYTTMVESVNRNEIILVFPEMFTATELITGNTLFCRFTDEKYEYNFKGEIDDIKIYFPQHIRLRLSGEISKFENIRQAQRENVILLANIFTFGTKRVVHSCICDISSTGMRAMSRYCINQTKDVEVHIALPCRNIFDSTVELKGKILWSKTVCNQNEYGIAITEINNVYKERLGHFLGKYVK